MSDNNAYDMTIPNMQFGQGSGFGGLANVGLLAFGGFNAAQQWADRQHARQMQQQLDPYMQKAQMAEYENQFQRNHYGAQDGLANNEALLYQMRRPPMMTPYGGFVNPSAPQYSPVNQFGGNPPLGFSPLRQTPQWSNAPVNFGTSVAH
jgi:hypothetical protein